MVHQHFMLVPVLTVAENILLGAETMANADLPRPRGGATPDQRTGQAVRLRDRPGCQGRKPVGRLAAAGGDPQGALSRSAHPRPRRADSGAHAPGDRRDLRRLAPAGRQGHSIIFISHKLYEVLEIADRITVIRRGKVVGSASPKRDERGRPGRADGRSRSAAGGGSRRVAPRATRARGRGPAGQGRPRPRGRARRRLEVRAGEILGIAGVAGNGQNELVEAIAGLRRPTAGTVTLDGKDITGAAPARDPRAGLGYVPADRQRYGLVLSFPVVGQPRPHALLSARRSPAASSATSAAIEDAARTRIARVRHPDALGERAGRHPLGRQPAEGRRRPRVQPRPEAPGPRPADAGPRRRQHRVHPPAGDRQAGRGDGRAARLGRAGRDPRALRPDRRHVPRPDRGVVDGTTADKRRSVC